MQKVVDCLMVPVVDIVLRLDGAVGPPPDSVCTEHSSDCGSGHAKETSSLSDGFVEVGETVVECERRLR